VSSIPIDPQRMARDDAQFREADHRRRVQVKVFANHIGFHKRLGLRHAEPHTLPAIRTESVMRGHIVTNFPARERFSRRFGSFSQHQS